MDDNVMKRYVQFICSEIPNIKCAQMVRPMDNNNIMHMKIGPKVFTMVDVEVIEKYTRSAKIRLIFDKYTDESIYYMSRKKGPEKLLSEIDSKITKIVNDRFIEDDRREELITLYEEKERKFGEELKKGLDGLK